MRRLNEDPWEQGKNVMGYHRIKSKFLENLPGVLLDKMVLLEKWQKAVLLLAIPLSAVGVWFLAGLPVWETHQLLGNYLFIVYLVICVYLLALLILSGMDRLDIALRRKIAAVCLTVSVVAAILFSWFLNGTFIFSKR